MTDINEAQMAAAERVKMSYTHLKSPSFRQDIAKMLEVFFPEGEAAPVTEEPLPFGGASGDDAGGETPPEE